MFVRRFCNHRLVHGSCFRLRFCNDRLVHVRVFMSVSAMISWWTVRVFLSVSAMTGCFTVLVLPSVSTVTSFSAVIGWFTDCFFLSVSSMIGWFTVHVFLSVSAVIGWWAVLFVCFSCPCFCNNRLVDGSCFSVIFCGNKLVISAVEGVVSLSVSVMNGLWTVRKRLFSCHDWLVNGLQNTQCFIEWMNEFFYIAHKKTSTQNLACSQRQIHTVHTCKLSQAKTTKGHALIPTHPFPKVELYITVKCKKYIQSYK